MISHTSSRSLSAPMGAGAAVVARRVAGPGVDVRDLPVGDRLQEDLVADASALEDHAVLDLAPQPACERRDHVSRPPRRENPVRARASASATWDGLGSSPSLRSRWTECWIWCFEAAPWAATARLTSAGASASTFTSHWLAARQITPRAWAMSSAVRGNRYSV